MSVVPATTPPAFYRDRFIRRGIRPKDSLYKPPGLRRIRFSFINIFEGLEDPREMEARRRARVALLWNHRTMTGPELARAWEQVCALG